jgi:hypothetical protein
LWGDHLGRRYLGVIGHEKNISNGNKISTKG